MKFLLISAALMAVACASPVYVNPGLTFPGPVVDDDYVPINVGPAIIGGEYEPISVGPAIIGGEYEPISVGPAIIGGEYEPISVGPAIVEEEHQDISVGPAIVGGEYEPISVGPAIINEVPAKPALVQIIVNINSQTQVIDVPLETPVHVEEDNFIPSPVIVVDEAEEINPAPAPGVIGTPVLPIPIPEPVITLPEDLN